MGLRFQFVTCFVTELSFEYFITQKTFFLLNKFVLWLPRICFFDLN